jgi:hypothetical protein
MLGRAARRGCPGGWERPEGVVGASFDQDGQEVADSGAGAVEDGLFDIGVDEFYGCCWEALA